MYFCTVMFEAGTDLEIESLWKNLSARCWVSNPSHTELSGYFTFSNVQLEPGQRKTLVRINRTLRKKLINLWTGKKTDPYPKGDELGALLVALGGWIGRSFSLTSYRQTGESVPFKLVHQIRSKNRPFLTYLRLRLFHPAEDRPSRPDELHGVDTSGLTLFLQQVKPTIPRGLCHLRRPWMASPKSSDIFLPVVGEVDELLQLGFWLGQSEFVYSIENGWEPEFGATQDNGADSTAT